MSDKENYMAALRAVGVKADDVCYCHSDMTPFMLGRDEPRELRDAWGEALEETLPVETATLILPTFCWDFYEGKLYDPQTARCNTGCLNEHLRNRPGYFRTPHPAFSHIVRGRCTAGFLETDMDAFGLGSVFGRLYGMHSKILFVGVPFAKCCTFVHFIEQLWGVPYRQQRHFRGKVLTNGVEAEQKCSHFAKPLDGSVTADFEPLETLLRNENFLRETEVDGGTVGAVETRFVFQCARKLLSENVESLITRNKEV